MIIPGPNTYAPNGDVFKELMSGAKVQGSLGKSVEEDYKILAEVVNFVRDRADFADMFEATPVADRFRQTQVDRFLGDCVFPEFLEKQCRPTDGVQTVDTPGMYNRGILDLWHNGAPISFVSRPFPYKASGS